MNFSWTKIYFFLKRERESEREREREREIVHEENKEYDSKIKIVLPKIILVI